MAWVVVGVVVRDVVRVVVAASARAGNPIPARLEAGGAHPPAEVHSPHDIGHRWTMMAPTPLELSPMFSQ